MINTALKCVLLLGIAYSLYAILRVRVVSRALDQQLWNETGPHLITEIPRAAPHIEAASAKYLEEIETDARENLIKKFKLSDNQLRRVG